MYGLEVDFEVVLATVAKNTISDEGFSRSRLPTARRSRPIAVGTEAKTRYLTVKLHKRHWFGPVHLAYACNNINGEFWAIVSDEPTSLQTFREYGLRFDIEESFLDDQSGGWNLQKSEIRSVCALSRLWFLLAVATLYLTAQGVEVVESGQRRCVDPHWFRGNSYFRIGWDWVKTALWQGWRLIRAVSFSSSRDPEPAMASRRQHEARSYGLEFRCRTFRYPPD